MSKKKIFNGLLIAILAVLVVSVSAISYSIATKETGSKDIKNKLENRGAQSSGSEDYISNIDRIIENSYSSDENKCYFNVVEILPENLTVDNTGLSKYIDNGLGEQRFKKFVIDSYKNKLKENMKDNTIKYTCLKLNSEIKLDTLYSGDLKIKDILDKADLIYLSSPEYLSYSSNYNISNEIYEWLENYSMNSYKPLIMDFVTPYEPEPGTFESFIYKISNVSSHLNYRTFFWDFDASTNPDDFFTANSVLGKDDIYHNISYYLPLNVNNGKKATGNILVISESEHRIADALSAYNLKDDLSGAYYGVNKPKKFIFDYKKVSELTPEMLTEDEKSDTRLYDFIILEKDIMKGTPALGVLDKLEDLSVLSQYIIYDKSVVPKDADEEDVKTSNYLKLQSVLLKKNGTSNFENVLPLPKVYDHFNKLNGNLSDEESISYAKPIADLINGSDYRGSLIDGTNGKMFRVLELQPCYPIDLQLAKNRNKRTHQATNFDKGPIISYSDQFVGDYYQYKDDYYNFELSKDKVLKVAEIANKTGIKLDPHQVQIVQMSTEEFIGSKSVVLDTYDLVYVGGNTSALTPASLKTPYGVTHDQIGISTLVRNYFPVFDMYTHTGIPVKLQPFVTHGDTKLSNKRPYGEVQVDKTYVTYNGNDITLTKLNELKLYIDKGMPIVFSNVVSNAFDDMAKQKRLVQLLRFHSIDPDSYMFEFLSYAKNKYVENMKDKTIKNSILWNFDITNDQNDSTIFNEKSNSQLAQLLIDSNRRPALTIIKKPKEYKEGFESSYNINENGIMTIAASAKTFNHFSNSKLDKTTNYNLKLFVDIDANGSFSVEDGEMVDFVENIPEESIVNLEYTFDDPQFFGVVHWMVLAEPSDGKGGNEVRKGFAAYKRTGEKKEVNILQIMPVDPEMNLAQTDSLIGEKDGHGLYMCTECQMAKFRAKYNIQTALDPLLDTGGNKEKLTSTQINMGLHEHKFGIVQYDTDAQATSGYDVKLAPNKGSENWDFNYADYLANDYDFNTDIIYLNELETISNKIYQQTEAQRLINEKEADKARDHWFATKKLLADSGIEEKLNTYLEGLKNSNTKRTYTSSVASTDVSISLTNDMIDSWINHKAYYRAFYFIGSDKKEFNDLYTSWVKYHDDVVNAYNDYRTKKQLSYSREEWLSKNYDVVVLGFAENFGRNDLNVDQCEDIKYFVKDGGMLLTTHDSTTRYKDGGSINLTKHLRSVFGMDRYHVTSEKNITSGSYPYNEYEEIISNESKGYYFSSNGLTTVLFNSKINQYMSVGPINITNKNIVVKIDNSTGKFSVEEKEVVDVGKPLEIIVKLYKDMDSLTANKNQISIKGNEHFVGLYEGPNSNGNTLKHQGSAASSNDSDIKISGITSKKPVEINKEVPIYDEPKHVEKKINVEPNSLVYSNYIMKDFLTSQSTHDLGRGEYALPGQQVYWQNKMKSSFSDLGKIEPVGLTDYAAINSSYYKSTPYLYAELDGDTSMTWNNSVWDDYALHDSDTIQSFAPGGTDRASRNNRGIVTTYPFTLPDELRIARTHAQTFALDMEDEGIAVWYSLAGCDGRLAKTRGSLFKASPRDGRDSYFLYTYAPKKINVKNFKKENDEPDYLEMDAAGTVNYCGAGHSCITGVAKDNNHERRLYINLIVNAVRNKSSNPKVTIHDKGNEKNNEVLFNDAPLVKGNNDTNPVLEKNGEYVYKVDDLQEIPEFNFKTTFSPKVKIKEIKVFYDLDYGMPYTKASADKEVVFNTSNVYEENNNHVLVYNYSPASKQTDVEANKIKEFNTSIVGRLRKDLYSEDKKNDSLKLKPSYFDPYGTYTYLVVWMKDENGKTASQRIKIKLKEHLFDLTDAEFDNFDIIDYSYNVDKTDRKRFSI